MATLQGVGYKLVYEDSNKKFAPGEFNGLNHSISDYFIPTAILALNDEVNFAFIPEGAIITDAKIHIPASLGATGIVEMGLRAYDNLAGTAVVEDPDSLASSCDGGGAAALTRLAAGQAAYGAKIGKGGAQIFLKCTEAVPASAVNKIYIEVNYLMA